MGATMALPPIVVPAIASSGNLTVNTTATLGAGDVAYGDFVGKPGSVTTIVGPARVVVNNFQLRSTGQLLIDNSAGAVELYVVDDFVLSSNTMLRPLNDDPADFEINLLSDNVIDPGVVVDLDTIDFNSNAKMYGTIYAPNANIEINSNFELFGALIAHSVDLDSNCTIHYDEQLAISKGGAPGDYQALCWRSLPYKP